MATDEAQPVCNGAVNGDSTATAHRSTTSNALEPSQIPSPPGDSEADNPKIPSDSKALGELKPQEDSSTKAESKEQLDEEQPDRDTKPSDDQKQPDDPEPTEDQKPPGDAKTPELSSAAPDPPENGEEVRSRDGDDRSRERRRRRRSSRSPGSPRDYSEPRPIPKVVHKVEYRHVSSNAVVFEEESDRFSPFKSPPEQPVLEVITVAFTAQAKSPYSYRQDTVKPPPIHSMGNKYIMINSAAVINALRAVVEYYPGQNLIGDSITMAEPYAILVHHQEELEQYRQNFAPEAPQDDDAGECVGREDTFEHLGIILDFLKETLKDRLEKEYDRHKREVPVTTYDMLWTLFKPGTDVYWDSLSCGIFDSFVVKYISWDIVNGSPARYQIGLWNLFYDSIHIGPRNFAAVVVPFDGEKEIAKLDVFPCEFLREDVHKETHKQKMESLTERGKMYFRMTSKQCMWYDGLTTTFPRTQFTGLTMVDMESYLVYVNMDKGSGRTKPTSSNPAPGVITDDVGEKTIGGIPNCTCKRCSDLNNQKKKSKFADYARINPMTKKELTPHMYFLCDRSVYAFIMKVRSWHRLDVSYFSEPKYNTKLVNDLVLPSDTRALIKALSTKYTREDGLAEEADADQWSADFVEGKGEGMIMLLHGKPGVGKTYTAECIAEYTKRPLLSLTCTDIGTNPATIESKLTYWFKLAKHWGAILLIDEADIYMEHRVTRDLERNNLVAGFLRAMEYYQGIMFLTTNRVGTFDEAFISRIHISIHYPEFTDRDRAEVWESFFRKLGEDRGGEVVIDASARRYVADGKEIRAVKWNGREIRNAFQTAVALAEVEQAEEEEKLLQQQQQSSAAERKSNGTSDEKSEQGQKEEGGKEQDVEKAAGPETKEGEPEKKGQPKKKEEEAAEEPKKAPVLLKDTHIRSIVRMSRAFKKYLEALHYGDESKRAAREGLRVDDFDEEGDEGAMNHYV